jgi:hypothetical protein
MRKIQRHVTRLAVFGSMVLALGAGKALAGDWGLRMGGSLGTAPDYAAETFFDASKTDFQYSARGMELGVTWKDWDVSAFVHTINKGVLNRGYAQHSCGLWNNGRNICLPAGTTLPEGTQVDLAGLRLAGVQAGRFIAIYKPKKWLRFGVPVHLGMAFFSGHATQYDTRVALEPTDQGYGFVARSTPTQISGSKVFAGGFNPYPVASTGIGLRLRSAAWAEIELNLLFENPRAPVFAWGMNFRKFKD